MFSWEYPERQERVVVLGNRCLELVNPPCLFEYGNKRIILDDLFTLVWHGLRQIYLKHIMIKQLKKNTVVYLSISQKKDLYLNLDGLRI